MVFIMIHTCMVSIVVTLLHQMVSIVRIHTCMVSIVVKLHHKEKERSMGIKKAMQDIF